MTVEKWLNRARYIDAEINALLTERESIYNTAERVEALGKPSYREYVRSIDKLCEKLIKTKVEIENAINSVQDDVLRTLLTCRYLCGMTWQKTAQEIGYSCRHTIRDLKFKAYEAVAEFIPDVNTT